MSVDDRLREAFGETDRSWDQRVPGALTAVTARRRRESVVGRGTAAALVAAAAVATVAVTVSQPGDEEQRPTQEPTSPTSGIGGAETNPLDGTWVSEPIGRAEVRRAARLAGDAADAPAMLAELPPLPFRVVLYVDGKRSSVHAVFRVEGRPEENADEENLTVTAERFVMQPMFAEGENVHTWVLDEGTLRLAFVSTTEGGSDGVPAEAWQRLVYDAAAFTSGT